MALEDSSASRKHASIIAREGKYFLRDEGSRNGTVLEGVKLATSEEVSLAHLDEFHIGIYEIRFAEKASTEAEIKTKSREKLARAPATVIPTAPPPSPSPSPSPAPPKTSLPPADQPTDDAGNEAAESLIKDLLKEKDDVETKLPPKKKRIGLWLALIAVLSAGASAGFLYRKPLLKNIEAIKTRLTGAASPSAGMPLNGPDNDAARQQSTALAPVAGRKTTSGILPPAGDAPVFSGASNDAKTTASDNTITTMLSMSDNFPVPDHLTVLTVGTTEAEPGPFSVFIDVATEPFPATIYLDDVRLGLAPFKTSIMVSNDKVYELVADFELRDLHDIYRKKAFFKARPDSDIIEIAVKGEIGVLKILKLPPRVTFYLEGYYDYDKLHANPVKLTDIRYGKPVFLPYGKYTVELREPMSVTGSQNLITQIRYQREFTVDSATPLMEIAVTDRDLKYFPAIIKSDPSAAEVYYNDEKMGATPFKGELPIGRGKLKITRDGYFDKIIDMDMRMNSVYETLVSLETSKVGQMLNKARELKHNDQIAEAINILVEALKYGGSAREKAEVYYLLGDAYFTQSQQAQAEPYFEKARTHPDFALRAALGLAKVYHALNNDSLAMTTVVEVLANLSPDTPPEVRGEAVATFKKISAIKSVIYVYTDPANANVYLNDKRLAQTTPIILSDLGLGNYRLEIEKPGFKTYRTRQTLKLGEFVMVKVKLEKEEL